MANEFNLEGNVAKEFLANIITDMPNQGFYDFFSSADMLVGRGKGNVASVEVDCEMNEFIAELLDIDNNDKEERNSYLSDFVDDNPCVLFRHQNAFADAFLTFNKISQRANIKFNIYKPNTQIVRSLEEIVLNCGEHSDVHIIQGRNIKVRRKGVVIDLPLRIPATLFRDFLKNDFFPTRREDLQRLYQEGLSQDIGWSYDSPSGERVRMRCNVFVTNGQNLQVAMRKLSSNPPDLEEIGFSPRVQEKLLSFESGLILVAGKTGSGKSTTLAALINRLAATRPEHILTIENPMEYIIESDNCLITQVDLSENSKTFAHALKDSLRQDPDIILVGEIRDKVEIETALTAADTGHLVLATVHATDCPSTISRIVNTFEDKGPISAQLSAQIKAIIAQRLIPAENAHGRACVFQIMFSSPAIRNQIKDDKIHAIGAEIGISKQESMVTWKASLDRLKKVETITEDVHREFLHKLEKK